MEARRQAARQLCVRRPRDFCHMAGDIYSYRSFAVHQLTPTSGLIGNDISVLNITIQFQHNRRHISAFNEANITPSAP